MHLSKSKQPNTFLDAHQIHHLIADGGTSGHHHPYSTPTSGYFFSAPSSPMHFVLSSTFPPPPSSTITPPSQYSTQTLSGSFDFDFSSHFSPNASNPNESMMSAEELFFNGQIRPMKLSSRLQALAPSLVDLEIEDEQDGNIIIKDSNREDSVVRGRDLSSRNRSLHRKARSVSPSPLGARAKHFFWQDEDAFELEPEAVLSVSDENVKCGTPSMDCSSSSSRSSSSSGSGRNSNKWTFLKDLLHRSKSERGSGNNKDRFWPYITSSPVIVKEKKLDSSSSSRDEKDKNAEKQKGNKQVRMKKAVVAGKPANGVVKRASAHELHYTANRAQAEEMKKKTYLPYRQGLLGCLGFSSKGYGALNGFTKTLNPVSSR